MDAPGKMRNTKIVCTIGPATSSPEMIRRLIRNGMNVARLNFSHGTHEDHERIFNDIRAAAKELGQDVGILQDLAGPKIRLGEISERRLDPGDEVVLVYGQKSRTHKLPINYPYIYEDVAVGNRILLADGKVELLVSEKREKEIHTHVVVGGVLTSHKGVNLPTSDLRIAAFTEKDHDDLEFGLKLGVDFVAMSFVRHERDLAPIREMFGDRKRPPILIAKIEKPQALERLPQILAAVEGVMVARGDLGVEMPVEEVPVIQKRIIREARRSGRQVITATQMLGSMLNSPRPSRAEVTDVANAVFDGTDAVMLSDETAVGKYPVEAVQVLDKVSRYTEPGMDPMRYLREELSELLPDTAAAITRAASYLARDLDIAAIVAATASGSTARLMSRFRTPRPVVGLTSYPETARQLCLSWGVVPALVPPCESIDEMVEQAREFVSNRGLAVEGDRLILTAGMPLQIAGTTNLLKVIDVVGPPEKGN
jgi:pyruvate kinase